jgi:hypothetical protein
MDFRGCDDDFEVQESIDVVEETERAPDVQLTFDEFHRLVAIYSR